MKISLLTVLACVASPLAGAEKAHENPLGKVLDLMGELAAKVTKEGEAEATAYKEYIEWCDDVSKNTDNTIKTLTATKGKLEAKTGQLTSDTDVAESKVGELAAAIATGESELKDATVVREREASDFAASDKELMEAIDALGRATRLLEKEMAKNP
eukprot:CAMPEP_0195100560 /NCGR_PEP_ID=MMETSP0448-20130528/63809_1 /TAXON_ID=66468 /ORGANISM="Heterocapsa triquestra, Strain CCMP 448" /LENGTH=155 /DNA_ID=CAMNT_0040135741 /DNA_START=27 /DNA_END=491 /DNA_ORIENTATION=+